MTLARWSKSGGMEASRRGGRRKGEGRAERGRMLRGDGALPVVLALTLIVTACAPLGPVPSENIVMFDRKGQSIDPREAIGRDPTGRVKEGPYASAPKLTHDAETAHWDEVIRSMREESPVRDGRRQVLVSVHGGLNTQRGSVGRAVRLAADEDLASAYYPVFVNWQSSLVSSYGEHVLLIRQGEEPGWAVLAAPVYFAVDVGRAILRAPFVWAKQLDGAYRTLPWVGPRHRVDERLELIGEDGTLRGIEVSAGEDRRQEGAKGKLDNLLAGTSYLVLLPVRMATTPLLDAFGTSAWDNMLRRTELLFVSQREFEKEGPDDHRPQGGLYRFLRRLDQEVASDPGGWEFTLVGHSMGAIVLNEMIRRTGPEGDFPHLAYSKIIYMAAACSVRDFEQSVIPYLRDNPASQFYLLTLHHKSEEAERTDLLVPYLDPANRGTLLVWIDDFLGRPRTPQDGTLGRFVNFLRAEHLIPDDVRGQIHVKEFDAGVAAAATSPRRHGEFDGFQFWKPEFYGP